MGCIFGKMTRDLYRLHITKDFYSTISDCLECVIHCCYLKKKHHIHFFPQTCTWSLLIGIYWAYWQEKRQKISHYRQNWSDHEINQECSVIKDYCPGFLSAILVNCIVPHEIHDSLLNDNGPKFIRSFFKMFCTLFVVKKPLDYNIRSSSELPGEMLRKSHVGKNAPLRCRAPTRFGSFHSTSDVHIPRPSTPQDRESPLLLVSFRQAPEPTTFVTSTAGRTDVKSKALPKELCFCSLSFLIKNTAKGWATNEKPWAVR